MMPARRGLALAAGIALPVAALGLRAEGDGPRYGAFSFERELVLNGTPEEVFDAFTGDVSPWWDHSFSEHPVALRIEPKVGGSFYETFDDAGNGVQHALVTWVERGKKLVFRGPLGLHGKALDLVHTFTFEPVEGGTRLVASVHGAGELAEGLPAVIEGAWAHFLDERFAPYFEGLQRD